MMIMILLIPDNVLLYMKTIQETTNIIRVIIQKLPGKRC